MCTLRVVIGAPPPASSLVPLGVIVGQCAVLSLFSWAGSERPLSQVPSYANTIKSRVNIRPDPSEALQLI